MLAMAIQKRSNFLKVFMPVSLIATDRDLALIVDLDQAAIL